MFRIHIDAMCNNLSLCRSIVCDYYSTSMLLFVGSLVIVDVVGAVVRHLGVRIGLALVDAPLELANKVARLDITYTIIL